MHYVCSDLHGFPIKKFMQMLDKIGFNKSDFLWVLGDVLDRGPDGIKILKWLMAQPNTRLILGNHESMFLACDFLFEEITENNISKLTGAKLNTYATWISNGGQSTLAALSALRNNEIKYIVLTKYGNSNETNDLSYAEIIFALNQCIESKFFSYIISIDFKNRFFAS